MLVANYFQTIPQALFWKHRQNRLCRLTLANTMHLRSCIGIICMLTTLLLFTALCLRAWPAKAILQPVADDQKCVADCVPAGLRQDISQPLLRAPPGDMVMLKTDQYHSQATACAQGLQIVDEALFCEPPGECRNGVLQA